ncbi:hypothetical protein LCGC14_0416770 [marine sediment metagenome]|uniref:HNH nuclease domain-containing protein n=1 Tax=marine sediment metagenome TaxID=412755 RepID=A0A0F9W1A5_9ZZZZ
MRRNLKCKNCGAEFESTRSDAKWCGECRKRRMREGLSTICPDCGNTKYTTSHRCQSCENKHRAQKGERSWNWKGGRGKHKGGYVIILKPQGYENLKHRYVFEHRVIWEKANGKLPEGYVIHHLNGIKDDNRLENLVPLPRSAHSGSTVLNVFKSRIRELESQIRALQSTTPA